MKLRKLVQGLGPSLITAALIFGPGSLTVNTKLGASFEFQLLWVIVVSVVFMVTYTQLSAKIGLHLKGSLTQEIISTYGKTAGVLLGLGIFCISASFQAGNSIGAGISLAELTRTSAPIWIILVSLIAIALLFFQAFYQILERIMIVMVLIMLLCFLITLLLSTPNLKVILWGLMPSIPQGSEILGIALVASSFSIVGAFYQSSLVREKGWTIKDLPMAKQESMIGIITLGFLSSLVMICAGSVLYRSGLEVSTAADLGKALEPLFGRFSSVAFMIGFLAASFSSLLGNATIGGALLADSFSLGQSLSNKKVRYMIILIIIMGSAIAITFGSLPLELIVFAQAITILLAPAAALFMLLIARKHGLVGSGSRLQTVLLALGLFTLISLAIYNFNHLFIA